MTKHCSSIFRYHPSSVPSPVPDTPPVAIGCSEQSHRLTCDHHSFTTDNRLHRSNNNHKNDLLQSVDEIPIRKRRKEALHRSEKNFSRVSMYVNHILLILIRSMILFIAALMISLTVYSAVVYIYPRPKKTRWEEIVGWLYQE